MSDWGEELRKANNFVNNVTELGDGDPIAGCAGLFGAAFLAMLIFVGILMLCVLTMSF